MQQDGLVNGVMLTVMLQIVKHVPVMIQTFARNAVMAFIVKRIIPV